MPRVLFSSSHCYLDPSSGAALSTRDLLELLARRGWNCRVFGGAQLDQRTGDPLAQIVSAYEQPYDVKQPPHGSTPFTLYHLTLGDVPVTVYEPPTVGHPFPSPEEGLPYLALLERLLDTFRPDLLLTYGGSWLAQESMALAKRRGVRVVFSLHNFAYHSADLFRVVDAVLVPSRFAQKHYQRTLGLTCTALPGPFNLERVRCPEVDGRYVTFVNPEPNKGVFVFARLAHELWRRRPDIPLLAVEGRGTIDWLSHPEIELRGVGNVHVMANTPDPRDFYRVSRLVLMPSLWNESLGRVPIEALLNGIPVLASNRGALPEVLAQSGLLLDIPAHYTPETRTVPTADEVAPWVEAILRLWDDPAYYAEHRQRCLSAAQTWHPDALGPRFDNFFRQVLG